MPHSRRGGDVSDKCRINAARITLDKFNEVIQKNVRDNSYIIKNYLTSNLKGLCHIYP